MSFSLARNLSLTALASISSLHQSEASAVQPVGKKAPVLTLSSPPPNFRTNADVRLVGTCQNGRTLKIDGGARKVYVGCAGGVYSETVALSAGDGVKTLVLSETDASGNVASLWRNFIKDTVKPSVRLTGQSKSPVRSSPLSVQVTFSKSISGLSPSSFSVVNARVVSVKGSGTVYQVSLMPLSQGTFSVSLAAGKVRDELANTNLASAVYSAVFDSLAPTVAIDSLGLGNSPTPNDAVRIIHFSGTGVYQYKAVVVNGTSCAGANFSSAQTTSIANAFNFRPAVGKDSVVCAIGSDLAGNWQAQPSASSVLTITRTYVTQPTPTPKPTSPSAPVTTTGHPRIFLTVSKIAKLRGLIATNSKPYLSDYARQVLAKADVSVGASPPIAFGTLPGQIMMPIINGSVLSPFASYITKLDSKPVVPQAGFYQVSAAQNNQNLLRDIATAVNYMAMAYVITGDTKYSDTVKTWVNAIMNFRGWDERFNAIGNSVFPLRPDPQIYTITPGDNGPSLATGSLLFALAMSYDWCYSTLPPSTIAALQEVIAYHANLILRTGGTRTAGILNSGYSWWATDYLQNHNVVAYSAMAVSAAALSPEEPDVAAPWFAASLSDMQKLQGILSDDGATAEGVSYGTYMVDDTTKTAQIFKDEKDADFTLAASGKPLPFWQNAGAYFIYHITPKADRDIARTFFGFNDVVAAPWYGPNVSLRTLARMNQDTDLQGFADLLDSAPPGQFQSKANANTDWHTIAFYDTDLPSTDFTASPNFPLFRMFSEYGEAISRSDWKSPYDSIVLYRSGLPAGSKMPYNSKLVGPLGSGHLAPAAGAFAIHGGDQELLRPSGYIDGKFTAAENTLTIKCALDATGKPLQTNVVSCNPAVGNKNYTGYIGQLGESLTGIALGWYVLSPSTICQLDPEQYFADLKAIVNPNSFGIQVPASAPSPIAGICSAGPMTAPSTAAGTTGTEIVNFCSKFASTFPSLCERTATLTHVEPNSNWSLPPSENGGVDYVIADASAAYSPLTTNMSSFKRHLIYLRKHDVLLEVSDIKLSATRDMDLLYHTSFAPKIVSNAPGKIVIDASGGQKTAFKIFLFDVGDKVTIGNVLVDSWDKNYLQTVDVERTSEEWDHVAAFSWAAPIVSGAVLTTGVAANVSFKLVPPSANVPAVYEFTVVDGSGLITHVTLSPGLRSVRMD